MKRIDYYEAHKNRLDNLNKIVSTLPGKTICDLGSMEGYLDAEREVCRIDTNKEFNPDIVADAGNVPIKSESFDIVVCSQLIEHIKDPLKIVKEAERILKPRGLLLIETANIASFKNRVKLFIGKNITWNWDNPKPIGHLHYREYTIPELREIIEKVGLIEKSIYACISHRCKWKGMILERISYILPKTWRKSIGIIGVKP